MVYVSCNPETLARDLRYMKKKGDWAEEAWVVDMFPWTESIETVVKLSRQENGAEKARMRFRSRDGLQKKYENT